MEVSVLLHLVHILLVHILPSFKCHLVLWIGCRWFIGVSQLQGIYGCCKVCRVLGIYDSDVGADFSSCSDVPFGHSLPHPIVDVALEPGFTALEPGMPPALLVGTTVPLPALVSSLTSLVVPTFGCLIALARVVPFTFIRHGNVRTYKILLRTAGHV